MVCGRKSSIPPHLVILPDDTLIALSDTSLSSHHIRGDPGVVSFVIMSSTIDSFIACCRMLQAFHGDTVLVFEMLFNHGERQSHWHVKDLQALHGDTALQPWLHVVKSGAPWGYYADL